MGQRGQGRRYPCRPYRVRLWRVQQAGQDQLEAEGRRLVLEVELEVGGLGCLEVAAVGHELEERVEFVVDPWVEDSVKRGC